MYSAIMTGLGNHLRNQWGEYKDEGYPRVNYGSSDSFWNKFNLDRLSLPGLIYASSSISYPKGLTGKYNRIPANTNTSSTIELAVTPTPITIEITLGMLGRDEEQHFWHIHNYLEMAIRNAEFEYPVVLDGIDEISYWKSSISNFSELSPPPSGKEFSTYDAEGQLYPLEGTFQIHSNILLTQELKIVRAVRTNLGDDTFSSSFVTTTDTEGMLKISRNKNLNFKGD